MGDLFETLEEDDAFLAEDDVLSRHRRSVNGTTNTTSAPDPTPAPAQPPQYKNAVEEFYADPNNRAMYLVLPLIILVYGGCSSIYCIYKCRRYLKRKRLENQKKKNGMDTSTRSSSIEENPDDDLILVRNTYPNQNDVPRPVPIVVKRPISAEPPPFARPASRSTLQEDMPLHDLEEELEKEQPEDKNDETSFSSQKSNIYPRISSRNDGSHSSQSASPDKIVDTDMAQERGAVKSPENKQQTDRPQSKQTDSLRPDSFKAEYRPASKQSNDKESEKELPKVKKFTDLTPKDIEDILNYYNDKKHMPDVIPDDTENMLPIRRKANKWKYRVFNA